MTWSKVRGEIGIASLGVATQAPSVAVVSAAIVVVAAVAVAGLLGRHDGAWKGDEKKGAEEAVFAKAERLRADYLGGGW